MPRRWRGLRAFCALGAAFALGACGALPVALLSTAGGVLAQALHLDAALVELWTAKHEQPGPTAEAKPDGWALNGERQR